MTLSTPSADCPRCASRFEPGVQDRQRCAACGGVFLSGTAVWALLDAADRGQLVARRQEGYRVAAEVPRKERTVFDEGESIRYLLCPVCQERMLRTRVLCDDAAVADMCARHGMWFDAGELEHTIEVLQGHGAGCREQIRKAVARHFAQPWQVDQLQVGSRRLR